MKIVSLILSIIVLFAAAYFFVLDFEFSTELNYLIYMSLLVILMLISVVGILLNLPFLLKQRQKINSIFTENNFSRKSRI